MVGDDDGVTQVIDTEAEFPQNGTYIDVDVYAVAPSERYPQGIKYSMQYGSDDGTTIFRYDNFPDLPDAPRHHKHVDETDVESVDFEGVFPLYRRFKQEVRANGEHWPNDWDGRRTGPRHAHPLPAWQRRPHRGDLAGPRPRRNARAVP